jgi:hypothetical protein
MVGEQHRIKLLLLFRRALLVNGEVPAFRVPGPIDPSLTQAVTNAG